MSNSLHTSPIKTHIILVHSYNFLCHKIARTDNIRSIRPKIQCRGYKHCSQRLVVQTATLIKQFHKQCDSVLKGARLFERFVKTLSIADFMKNMEGMV